ncbi:hypothetical protein, partial [Mycolicibacterium goodii]|uniref:hypothetical protein n=1 Tax=Mycolicibacterium goodii TaxID=134601 RepID=UPI00256F1760
QWATPPPNAGGGGGKTKWILGGVAVVLAIALTAVVTVLVVRPVSEKGATEVSSSPKSEFVSAADTGPVSIIIDDPTCDAWNAIAGEYSRAVDAVHWEDRDFNIPASSWTSAQRSMYDTVGKAMTRATDKTMNLAKQTPHRAMRELYEQFIAYTRAFVERISSYVAEDDNFVAASNGAGGSVSNICGAIAYHSAQAIAPVVPAAPEPKEDAKLTDAGEPEKFLLEQGAICTDWLALASKFSDETRAWRETNKSVPATDWDPAQKSINDAVAPIMSANADEMERLGQRSGNPVFEDIAELAAQYRRGFVASLPNYTAADSYLELSATNLVRLINWACQVPL